MNATAFAYAVQKQLPTHATTYSPCPDCGNGARGGDVCLDCLPKNQPNPERAKLYVDAAKASHAILLELINLEEAAQHEAVGTEFGQPY